MSGGEFDYAYLRVSGFVQSLTEKLINEENKPWYSFSPEVIKELNDSRIYLNKAAEMMYTIESLYSDGKVEKDFLEEMAKIKSELRNL